MTLSIRSLVLAVTVVCLSPLAAEAGPFRSKSSQPTSCPWWRPCGPGETFGGNKRVPQGAFGVDARPACQRHDECYEDPTTGRKTCDKNFHNDLRCMCENSTHPFLCKRLAKVAYLSVRLFGSKSKTT
jgi:hypothetical protein